MPSMLTGSWLPCETRCVRLAPFPSSHSRSFVVRCVQVIMPPRVRSPEQKAARKQRDARARMEREFPEAAALVGHSPLTEADIAITRGISSVLAPGVKPKTSWHVRITSSLMRLTRTWRQRRAGCNASLCCWRHRNASRTRCESLSARSKPTFSLQLRVTE